LKKLLFLSFKIFYTSDKFSITTYIIKNSRKN